MSQDDQISIRNEVKTRLNDLKPYLDHKNRSDTLDFLIDLFIIVRPLISEGNLVAPEKLESILDQLVKFRSHLKEPKLKLEMETQVKG
jgi:hypothetical protein